jgi:membrane-associated phospholipid phosphatase
MDDNLARVDAALGFNWLSFLAAANSEPWLGTMLVAAYHSLGVQLPALGLILVTLRREERLLEFIGLFAFTFLLTAMGMALVPAAGAYAYFNPRPELFESFTRHAGMWHYAELMKLRSGEPFVFLADNVRGMVTFPSFHTVLGIIIAYALRGFRWLFAPVAILNAVMIVSTLPEGGHHLVDVLAGIAIALIGLTLVRTLERAPLREKEAS